MSITDGNEHSHYLFWTVIFACGATEPQRGRTGFGSIMPARPSWFHQVAAALEALRASSALVVDRAGIEKLFGVSPRTAVRMMNWFGGYQAGKTFLIGRQDLIAALESLEADETFGQELRRPQRVSEDLERMREDLKARQVKLPVSPAADPGRASSLPSGIRVVRPGVLEVEFASAEDLLGRLWELVQLAGRNLDVFDEAVRVQPDWGWKLVTMLHIFKCLGTASGGYALNLLRS